MSVKYVVYGNEPVGVGGCGLPAVPRVRSEERGLTCPPVVKLDSDPEDLWEGSR